MGFTEIKAEFCGSTGVRASRNSSRQIAFLHVKGHKIAAEDTRILEINLGAVAHRAMWGYGVDPPSAWNPSIGEWLSPCGCAGDRDI